MRHFPPSARGGESFPAEGNQASAGEGQTVKNKQKTLFGIYHDRCEVTTQRLPVGAWEMLMQYQPTTNNQGGVK
jgi:hypothetical protein